jgi:hypothetical protein
MGAELSAGGFGRGKCTEEHDRKEHRSTLYVSNVSIIFDAPCLFLHHLLSVSLHFMAFYAFSGTNLLTRCHSVSSLFSAIFVFQKSYTGNIFSELDKTKAERPDIKRSF